MRRIVRRKQGESLAVEVYGKIVAEVSVDGRGQVRIATWTNGANQRHLVEVIIDGDKCDTVVYGGTIDVHGDNIQIEKVRVK